MRARIPHYEPVCSADFSPPWPVCSADFSPHWLKIIEKLSVLQIDNIL